jgi:hypothetical protein
MDQNTERSHEERRYPDNRIHKQLALKEDLWQC